MSSSHNLKQPKFRRKKSEIDALFSCPKCQKRFTRKFDMHKHIQNKHPDKVDNITPSVKSKNVEILKKCKADTHYTCDICNSNFVKSSSLLRHRNTHLNEKPYCCHICGAKFQTSEHLTRHIEQLHYDRKKFHCVYCDQWFKSKPTRDEHLNIHTQARPFMCDICGRAFKQKASLYVHKKFHGDVFPFECRVCDKKFRRNGDLKVHQWIHSGERPYSCDICKKSFRLGQDLKRHYRTHGTYTCGDCNLSFDQMKSFKAHKKLHNNKT
nr:gastrula zinc finger protein XlCGF71.1-like [Leptinotarsa decemlineata]